MPKLSGLKLARLKRGWPLRVVASQIGVSETWISKWENLLEPVPEKYLIRLVALYGVEPAELLKDFMEKPGQSA